MNLITPNQNHEQKLTKIFKLKQVRFQTKPKAAAGAAAARATAALATAARATAAAGAVAAAAGAAATA